jgi:hypothetical protein
MAITKLSSGPYTIHTINATDPITLDADSVYINGNLVVLGKTSTIETTNTVIYDNIVTLNGGIIGSPFVGNAGIEVNRGGGIYNNVAIVWDEVQSNWTARMADGTWKYIMQSNVGAIGLSAVIDDPNPSLGGNLNLNSYTVSSNVGNMKLQGNVQINNTLVIPTSSVTNATVLYSTVPNSGAAGIYVLNSASANEELVTKKRALGFSLIF